jgi:hypothetical protein
VRSHASNAMPSTKATLALFGQVKGCCAMEKYSDLRSGRPVTRAL